MPFLDIRVMMYTLPALLIGLTLHEFAHGYAAWKLGDPTAKNLGRLTLNPIKHLELVGAIFLLVFGFGWAKPVPVNPMYFRGDRKKGMLWVSLAGPATNFVIAILTALIWKFVQPQNDSLAITLGMIFRINLVLAVFNFLPIPPLDGSKILAGILPTRYMPFIYNLERYGFAILILLSMTGILSGILGPGIGLAGSAITSLLGVQDLQIFL